MTTAAGTTAVDEYLVRLRAELADLPPGEVEDILDDVGVQLAESGDELGRLGSPEAYAVELRAAAGYPAAVSATVGAGVPLRPRVGVWLLVLACVVALPVGFAGFDSGSGVALVLALLVLVALPAALGWLLVRGRTGLRSLPEVTAVTGARERASAALPVGVLELLRALRPAWWVLRAGLAAVLVAGATGYTSDLATVAVVGLVLTLPSVWLGLRATGSRLWRWVTLPLDLFAVGVGIALLVGAGRFSPVPYYNASGPADQVADLASLPAYNVYPFDAAGNPLTGVYLFDQDGQPIRLYANPCYDGTYETTSGQENGSNAYPLPNVVNDPQTGRCVSVPGVPFTALVPRASATPTTVPGATSSAPSPSSGVGSASTTPPAEPTTSAVPTTTG